VRCPFGCRRHHRRQSSNRRSTAFYQTADGKRKKKRLNGRRRSGSADCRGSRWGTRYAGSRDLAQSAAPADEHGKDALPVTLELRLQGVVLDESGLARSPMLPYVRMIVGLIEGVELNCREVLCLLRQSMRQRSIADRRRIDYVLGFLHQHPP